MMEGVRGMMMFEIHSNIIILSIAKNLQTMENCQ